MKHDKKDEKDEYTNSADLYMRSIRLEVETLYIYFSNPTIFATLWKETSFFIFWKFEVLDIVEQIHNFPKIFKVTVR